MREEGEEAAAAWIQTGTFFDSLTHKPLHANRRARNVVPHFLVFTADNKTRDVRLLRNTNHVLVTTRVCPRWPAHSALSVAIRRKTLGKAVPYFGFFVFGTD